MNENVHEYIRQVRAIPRIERLYQVMRETYEQKPHIAHGWDHVYRTFVNAMVISMSEPEVNIEIVAPAMLLHDIGFLYNNDPSVHPDVGADNCRGWLGEWSMAEQERIEACIRNHKGMMEGFGTKPLTLEECIVCDSDLLEKTGYLGALQGVRVFVEFGEAVMPKYRSLKELAKHLKDVDEVDFFTDAGRDLAKERGGIQVRKDIFNLACKEMEMY